MSAISSFFDQTFLVNGTEGAILLAVCIAALVCTLAAIALAVIVIVTAKRRKREKRGELPPQSQNSEPSAAPAEQTELPAQTPAEALAEGSEQTPAATPAATSAQTPAATSPKIYTRTESAIFVRSGTLYNKSFTAKLIQSPDEVKGWYAALKNLILSYKNVKARTSWKCESFRSGRKMIARFGYRGNTLCLYLPLDPAEYADAKYKVENVSDHAAHADAPCMYRIKNERHARYAAELIAVLMSGLKIERTERATEDYYLPYEQTEPLIERGLIKVVTLTPRAPTAADDDPQS